MTSDTRYRGFEWLNGHKGRVERRAWEPWLQTVGEMREAFAKAMEDDPVLYNETATMGLLSAAANRCGLLSMAEYACWKRGQDRRKRTWGRADLWVYDPSRGVSWSFEAKQIACVNGVRRSTLDARMATACDDADKITMWESKQAYGLLVVVAPEGECSVPMQQMMKALADDCDLACRLGGGDQRVFLFFRVAQARAKSSRAPKLATA